MKTYNKSVIVAVVLLLSVLGSCINQSSKNKGKEEIVANNYRLAVELVVVNVSEKDSVITRLETLNAAIYHWKNHIVLFGEKEDTLGLGSILKTINTRFSTRIFDTPLYVYDKSKHCADSAIELKWRDYLLTANLVEDTLKQKEYIRYHQKQFEEWPEVAQGFCHAGFQQLLVYKNGRQLLLVISIPADKTLGELDPLTIEDNPRMVEWNNIMGTYQEGIKGTDEGETWVFLDEYGEIL